MNYITMKKIRYIITIAATLVCISMINHTTASARLGKNINKKFDYVINISKTSPEKAEAKLKKIKSNNEKKIVVKVKAKNKSSAKKKIRTWLSKFKALPQNRFGLLPFNYNSRNKVMYSNIKLYKKSKTKGYYEYTPNISAYTLSRHTLVNEALASDYANYTIILDRLFDDFPKNNFACAKKIFNVNLSDSWSNELFLQSKGFTLDNQLGMGVYSIDITTNDINRRFIVNQLAPYFSLTFSGFDPNNTEATGRPSAVLSFTPNITVAELENIVCNFDEATKFYFFNSMLAQKHKFVSKKKYYSQDWGCGYPLSDIVKHNKVEGVCQVFAETSIKLFEYLTLDSTDNVELVNNDLENHGVAQFRLKHNGQALYVISNNAVTREGFYNFNYYRNASYISKLTTDAKAWSDANGLTDKYIDSLGYLPKDYSL